MACKEFTLNKAEYIIEGSEEIQFIKEVVSSLRLPLCPGYAKPNYPVNQKILNAMFRHKLKPAGWKADGVLVAPKEFGLNIGQKGDFSKTLGNGLRVFVEVEFGNIASVFRNLFKFNLIRDIDTYDLAVLIIPCDNFASEVEGVYSFEAVKRILDHAKNSVMTPLLVLGIEPDRDNDINCLPLEPDWEIPGETTGWKSQSEPAWDEFVSRHADKLF